MRNGTAQLVFDVGGIPSIDVLGSSNNFVTHIAIGAFNSLVGIGWDVMLQTLVPGAQFSYIEMTVTHTGGGFGNGVGVLPGFPSNDSGGPTAFSTNGEILKLADAGIPPVYAGPDGLLRLEFSMTIDNSPGQADAQWTQGEMTFELARLVPAPGTVTLAIACAGVLSFRRRV